MLYSWAALLSVRNYKRNCVIIMFIIFMPHGLLQCLKIAINQYVGNTRLYTHTYIYVPIRSHEYISFPKWYKNHICCTATTVLQYDGFRRQIHLCIHDLNRYLDINNKNTWRVRGYGRATKTLREIKPCE